VGLKPEQQGLRSWQQPILLLALILAAGAALRLYGWNWDGGHWLHPDERQIYFVALELEWPHSLGEALSPDSPLNPRFFAYGSLSFYLLRLGEALLSLGWPAVRHPENLHLAGRLLATAIDLGTVFLTYRLAHRLVLGGWGLAQGQERDGPSAPGGVPDSQASPGPVRFAAAAAALVSLAVLPVQLAHFYTADTLLAFAVVLTLNLAADVAQGAGRPRQIALGIALGLALGIKLNAASLILSVVVARHVQPSSTPARDEAPRTRLSTTLRRSIATSLVAGFVFIAVQPYALIDWPRFLEHTLREAQIAQGSLQVPYTLQYEGTVPLLYSIWQTALWGLGPPLGLVAWTGLAMSTFRWLRDGGWADALLLSWAGPYLIVTGFLQTRYLRYMLPLVPVLCIFSARALADLRPRRLRIAGIGLVGAGTLGYALLLVSVYATPHSWIEASAWIYREVPEGSTLAVEHWDTPLPLPLEMEGSSWRSDAYDIRVLAIYAEPDDASKWAELAGTLADADYLIIASRRLYGSIPRRPDRYPLATRYYRLLFNGELGFEVVGEFTRGPQVLNPRLPPLPGAAPALLRPDESFVVYDHPRALLLRNEAALPRGELLQRLATEPDS
jgi:hypothetical protein